MAKRKKMNKNITYHLMILDRSGSMEPVRDVTISGLNEQLQTIRKDQEKLKLQEQRVCFVTFDNEIDHTSLWDKNIKDINDFTRDDYVPGATTALRDAVGIGVTKLKEEIRKQNKKMGKIKTGGHFFENMDLSETDEPELLPKINAVVTIFTDGEENASHEYSGKQISDLIKEVKDTGEWTVSFLGCGDNVFEVAKSMGISQGDTLSYAPGQDGTQNAFHLMATGRSMRATSYENTYTSGSLDTSSINTGNNFFNGSNTQQPDLNLQDKTKTKEEETKEEK